VVGWLLPVLVAPAPLLPCEAPPRPHLPRPSAVFLPTFALRICAASCVSPHHSFRHCHIFPPHVIAHHEVAVENCANMCDMRLTVQFCALHSRFGDAPPAPFPSTPWPRQSEGARTCFAESIVHLKTHHQHPVTRVWPIAERHACSRLTHLIRPSFSRLTGFWSFFIRQSGPNTDIPPCRQSIVRSSSRTLPS
jgi:hypothetical protein